MNDIVINYEYLENLLERCLKSWKEPENDVALLEEFCKLNAKNICQLIDIWIDEIEIIKKINALIRMKESVKVLFDNKLIFMTLKTISLTPYSDSGN